MKKVRSIVVTVLMLLAAIIYAVFFLLEPAVDFAGGELTVTFIDVGQGDSILIQQGGNAILIDSGAFHTRERVISTLDSMGVTSLDFVIATHPHADHMGAMGVVIDTYDIGHVMMPYATNNTVAFERMLESIANKNLRIERPVPGSTVVAGNIELEIVAPNSESYSNLNNHSIITRLGWGDTSFLFTGDAEVLSENEVLENGFNISATVLDVGHHGSSTSTSENFLDAVNPEFAILSLAADNKYGHPHVEVMERLEARNIAVYRTDTMGTITLRSDGTNISIATER